MSWLKSLLWSALAALVAVLLMFWGRAAFQVRTLPERMVEWLLLFVLLDQFEQGIRTFGPKAKVYALYGGVGVMSAALLLIGAVALRRRWPGAAVLGLGLALYLVAMAGLMPLTGGGLFGTALFQNPFLVNGLYLGVALAHATVLLLAQVTSTSSAPGVPARPFSSRRALLLGAGGTAAAYAVALRQVATGRAAVASNLPLAQLPANGAATATVHPGLATAPAVITPEIAAQATAAGNVVLAPTASSPVQAPPTQAPQPTAPPPPSPTGDTSPISTPGAERALERDKDGALTAASRAKGEVAALVTPTSAHYVVTKNAVADPVLDAGGWRLVIDGEVNRPVQLDYGTLRRLPAVELYKTLECISNFTSMCELTYFGCDLMSTARWKGARLKDVLDLAGGLRPGVVSLQIQGADEYASSIPAALAADPDALLVYEMNGEVLPREHGYPVRLLVPGRYGMKNAKWVVGIRAHRTEFVDWYGQRNWSRTGIVKTMSRIDTPYNGQHVLPGRNRIAGIAYAGDRGVGAVQFSTDGGRTWNPTVFLESQLGRDTWVRWQAEFDVAPGEKLTLTCRAQDGQGQWQTNVFTLPQPDGGSGYHSVEVTA